MDNKKITRALLTCGPQLCKIEDFLECCNMGIYDYRIHLGKTDRDNFILIENLIKTQEIINHEISIYVDIPTTRPRLGSNLTNSNNITIPKGESFNIIFDKDSMWKYHMNKSENNIHILNFGEHKKAIYKGDRIMLKDGSYSGIITDVNCYGMVIMCTSDVILYESESLIFPDTKIEYDVFDSKIKCFMTKLKRSKMRVNKFIISFCHSKQTVNDSRKYLTQFFGYDVFIMAKIEDVCGVDNIHEIALEADFIMIGRGDLGPSIGFDHIPKVQECIVSKVKTIDKPIYIATPFLEELAQKDRLCAPEVNDLYLAIKQGATGIMLSGEAGGSPNSKKCIKALHKMINYYEFMEDNNMKNLKQHTQILATMGPTLQSVEEAENMIKLGVYQFRIHMGLRTRDFCGYYRNAITASEKLKEKINVLLDLPSTRPRVVNMKEHTYKKGEFAFIFDCDSNIHKANDYTNISLPNFVDILQYMHVGEHVMFRDGHVIFEVKEIFDTSVLVQCSKSDVCIKTGASSCFPESDIIFQSIEEIDIAYLKKMKDEGLCPERVAISFASTPDQISRVRVTLNEIWANNYIEIICKIESRLGLKNIDQLIECSDGIMIARGDLLLCIDPYKLPEIQMNLAKKCTEAGKILIIATEFFERYAETGIVNRAELSDVALAVRQGANSIMLARETGNSQYNFGCVNLINAIIQNEIM